ncbi:MAG: ABC transporter ATP-binding protein [Verrucomicrobia bacterium]|nr:ABC transporter ATP-binding protein [Verrucomicrobiota bacterium]
MIGSMVNFLKSPLSNFRRLRNQSRFDSFEDPDIIWPVRDISFKVDDGEVVGVIGRNGAGKSTLLKLLSRITDPTRGSATIYGRVGSLLEVGTGFHPDLTGRENIYLNGTILGMKKREIDEKFDEIVAFSDVAQFLDTPVKRYSSGMIVRLAFSVAAHLEPEILIVDEVLAVGDASFQKKCLGKMQNVASHGRTVLFVSHNMAAINQLCDRCLVLEKGRLIYDGEATEGVDHYLKIGAAETTCGAYQIDPAAARRSDCKGQITRIELQDLDNGTSGSFGIGEPFQIRVHVTCYDRISMAVVGAEIMAANGTPMLNLRSDSQNIPLGPYSAGDEVIFTIQVPGLPLYPGLYRIDPWFGERRGKRIDQIRDAVSLSLEVKGRLQAEHLIQPGRAIMLMDCEWTDAVVTKANQ